MYWLDLFISLPLNNFMWNTKPKWISKWELYDKVYLDRNLEVECKWNLALHYPLRLSEAEGKCEYYTEVIHDSPADFIWRWHIIGCGVHLGNDNVGILSKLEDTRRETVNCLQASSQNLLLQSL